MTVNALPFASLSDRPIKKYKTDEPTVCRRCRKVFTPLSGRKRLYCYDPVCEEAREREHNTAVARINRERLRAGRRAAQKARKA